MSAISSILGRKKKTVSLIGVAECKNLSYLWETNPVQSVRRALEEAKKEAKTKQSAADIANGFYKDSVKRENGLKNELTGIEAKIVKIHQEEEKLQSRRSALGDELEEAQAKTAEIGEDAYEKNAALLTARERVTAETENKDIVETVVNEPDIEKRPLGKKRDTNEEDWRAAVDVEGVGQIQNMHGTVIERCNRFLKVMGVEQAHVNRNTNAKTKRVDFVGLLFPNMLPTGKVKTAGEQDREIVEAILREKEQEDQHQRQAAEAELQAAEAKARDQALINQLFASMPQQPANTARAPKRDASEMNVDPNDPPMTPEQKVIRVMSDPETQAVLIRTILSECVVKSLVASSPRATQQAVAQSFDFSLFPPDSPSITGSGRTEDGKLKVTAKPEEVGQDEGQVEGGATDKGQDKGSAKCDYSPRDNNMQSLQALQRREHGRGSCQAVLARCDENLHTCTRT